MCKEILTVKYIKDSVFAASPIFKPEESVIRYNANIRLFKQLMHQHAPWIPQDLNDINELDINDHKSLQTRYESIFGKLDSPEMISKLEAARSLNKRNNSTADLKFN